MANKITEVIVEPTKIYINSSFTLKIKIEDDLFSKKYIATEDGKRIVTENEKNIITEWS